MILRANRELATKKLYEAVEKLATKIAELADMCADDAGCNDDDSEWVSHLRQKYRPISESCSVLAEEIGDLARSMR